MSDTKNKSTVDLINELNELDESNKIEAKEISGNKAGKSIYETICAFANEPGLGGGTILLGIKKEESLFAFYSISGIEDPDKISNDISNACQTMFNAPIRPNITREQLDKKIVLRVDVDEVQSSQKPIFIKNFNLPREHFVGSVARISIAHRKIWRHFIRMHLREHMMRILWLTRMILTSTAQPYNNIETQ